MPDFDVIVIGAGPGGYVAAIRAAQLGLEVASVEKEATLGGTCVRVGCIPSKVLLESSERFVMARDQLSRHGVVVGDVSLDLPTMMRRKDEVVKSNTDGVAFLYKKHGITRFKGVGELQGRGHVIVRNPDGDTELHAEHVVLATGSAPAPLEGVEIDGERIITSDHAIALGEVPGRLAVIGAGVIGLELGSVWARLGAEVHVIEYLDQITPGMDGEVCKQFQRLLSKQGLKFTLGAAVQGIDEGDALTVRWKRRKDDKEGSVEADVVLVATGRRPHTANLGLEDMGIDLDSRGRIATDDRFRTRLDGTYAIGDVIAGPMLAHKAMDEGHAVADIIAGHAPHLNRDIIPSVIYTHPEVAAVGRTEEQLKEEGRAYKIGKFPFLGNARAKSMFAGDGFVKLLADADTDRILGAHVIGPMAGDLIHEVCVAMEFGASAEDLAATCHAHPTFSEAMREAAYACGDGALHA